MKALKFFILLMLCVKQGYCQVQWFPTVLQDDVYIKDTIRYKYPVTNLIETKDKINLYGRGTRYPTALKYDTKAKAWFSNGIIMTSRPDNKGYHGACYRFTKRSTNEATLYIKKENGVEEEIVYIKSQLPVHYPQGN